MRKKHSAISRYTVLWVVILGYALPVVALSVFSPFSTDWQVMSLGLFLSCVGSLAVFCAMVQLQKGHTKVQQVVKEEIAKVEEKEELPAFSLALQQAESENRGLHADIDALTHKVEKLVQERDAASKQGHNTLQEWEEYRRQVCEQMAQQQSKIQALQEELAERQSVYDKKQQQIGVLESKVGDLTYEIKTLLQLAEAHSGSLYTEATPAAPTAQAAAPTHSQPDIHFEEQPITVERQVRSHDEASLQLKRCIDIAQKITGSQRFMTQFNAFRDYPVDGFALDLRRLCDSLRSENSSTVLLYSPKENQLLFSNNQIKGLTGWSPDKFVQHFHDIILDEKTWRQGINALALRSEVGIEIPLKNKSGQDILVNAHVGMIPTGIFKNHAIAILYGK